MAGQERLEKLRQQREKLNRAIRLEESRMRGEERKRETRRKIILGALVMKHMDLHPNGTVRREMDKLINQYVTSEQDRALFGLEPLPGAADTASNDGAGLGEKKETLAGSFRG
jgi:hypothetical protein